MLLVLVGQFPIDFRLLGEKIAMCHIARREGTDESIDSRPTFYFVLFFIFFLLGLYLVVFLRSCIRLTS